MNSRKIKKMLRDESDLICSTVYDNISNELNIETPNLNKTSWWKNYKLLAPCSLALTACVLLTIFLFNGNNKNIINGDAYINLTITSDATSAVPSFSYKMNNNNTVSEFYAKNDDAKIIAQGVTTTENFTGTNFATVIVDQANQTGYLNQKSYNNTINIVIASLSIENKDKVFQNIKTDIETYCKNNYLYADIIYSSLNENIYNDLTDDKYEKIYQIYNLASIFEYISDSQVEGYTNTYYPSNDLSWWLEQFKDIDNKQLDVAIEKLTMINTALESDKAKFKFNKELERVNLEYYYGILDLKSILKKIKDELILIKQILQKDFNIDYESTYGKIVLPTIPSATETILDAWEWLFEIDDLHYYEDCYDDFYYDYDDPSPFDDWFTPSYDDRWDYEGGHHQPPHGPRQLNKNNFYGLFKNPSNSDEYIELIGLLIEDYESVIDLFDLYKELYNDSKNRILANIYYRVKDNDSDYCMDYNREYNDHKHNNPTYDDEWANNYDYGWWDYH